MEKISIRLDIAGVLVPMTIAPSDEELIRQVAKQINQRIVQMRGLYAVTELSMLLAMVCLQLALEYQEKEEIFERLEMDMQQFYHVLDEMIQAQKKID